MNKTVPIATLTFANQTIWLFDLKLPTTARGERRVILDTLLKDFFTQKITSSQQTNQARSQKCIPYWQQLRQFSHIIHTPAQPAKAMFLSKNDKIITLPLAISYALPYVAVAVTLNHSSEGSHVEKIGLDICSVADFDKMAMAEKQHFCQDYFPHLPITHDSKALARRWSAFEATLKYHQLSLETAVQNPFFQQALPPLSVQSDKLYLDDHTFWLSVAVA